MPNREKTLRPKDLQADVHQLFFPDRPQTGKSVGLELEIWPFRETPENQAGLVRFYNEQGTGLIQHLEKLAETVEGMHFDPTPSGLARFTMPSGGNLTFEPGGQLEYSGPPFDSIANAISDITNVIERIRCYLKRDRIWLFHGGLNPWYTVDEVGLQLDKPRYVNMNNFFKAVGHYGQKMMRLSTSLQVNLDAGDPETAHRRWLAANLLAPVFTALFGNSPFVHGKASGAHSYRALIWQNLDPSRTGFTRGFLAPDYKPCPVEQYVDFALRAFVMRLPDAAGQQNFDGTFKTFQNWMDEGHNGLFPTIDDWINHLSTLFPEVRARGFFEVRYLDAQSKVWCSIPGILLTHLLYNDEAREEIIKIMAPYRTTLPGMLHDAAVKGMTEPEIAEISKKIFTLAMRTAGVENEAESVLELAECFYERYTFYDRNPASELIRLNDGELFSPEVYRKFEREQVQAAGDLLTIICDYV